MSSRRMGVAALGAAAALAGSVLWAGLASAQTVAGAVTLTGSTIQAAAGSNVTYTAQAIGVTNPEYQFWVEMPNGSWVDAQGYTTSNTFELKDVQAGNYLVVAYALTSAEIAAGDWTQAIPSPTDGVFVGSTVTLSLSAQDPAPNTTVTATASATNIYDPLYQFWYETPDGVWHQSGNYSSSNTFKIPAFTEQGGFKVIAYAKSPLAVNNPEGALYSNVVMGAASLSSITATPTAAVPNPVTGITATFDTSSGAVADTVTLPTSDYNTTTGTVVFTPPSTLGAGTYTVTVVIEDGNGNLVTCAPVTYTQG